MQTPPSCGLCNGLGADKWHSHLKFKMTKMDTDSLICLVTMLIASLRKGTHTHPTYPLQTFNRTHKNKHHHVISRFFFSTVFLPCNAIACHTRLRRMLAVVEDKNILGRSLGGNDERILRHVSRAIKSKGKQYDFFFLCRNIYTIGAHLLNRH